MMQDALQLGEMSSLSHSDLVEVSSEATESEDESSTTQDWSSSDITSSSDSDSEELEVVPAATESEAGRLLAARIPPELFDNILFYVNVTRASQRKNDWGNDLVRNQGEPSSNDILIGLKRCSLVCLFWANRCREHMFSERTLKIKSYEDAEIFRQYVVGGCPRLTPVHQLIRRIIVQQDYESRTSFLHLLYLPAIQDKLEELLISGPVPDGFNRAKLDTPHWGIPPYIVVPSSFLLKSIVLENVHLPSFYHVTKYIRHFTCATHIEFETITWDGETPTYSLPQASHRITCQRRPRSLEIAASGDCTDSVHLALTALMMNPNCPLHRLSEVEHMWMIKFMTLLWGDKKEPHVWIGFEVSEHAATMELSPCHFAFEEAPASADRSASALSVAGMHAYIYDSDDFPANLDALVNHARTQSTIRAFVLLFNSFALLQECLKRFIKVLDPATETIELVLAYEERTRRAAFGVDPVILEPNGRVYTWTDEQSEDYWGRPMSLQILQRQLEKNRWMSVN